LVLNDGFVIPSRLCDDSPLLGMDRRRIAPVANDEDRPNSIEPWFADWPKISFFGLWEHRLPKKQPLENP
jgi:hypothetical protein